MFVFSRRARKSALDIQCVLGYFCFRKTDLLFKVNFLRDQKTNYISKAAD